MAKIKGRQRRIAAIERLEAQGPIKTSMAILAEKGGRPVDGPAVKVLRSMSTGSQAKAKRLKGS